MKHARMLGYAGLAALLIVFALRFEAVMRGLFLAFLAGLFALFLVDSGRRISARVGLSAKLWSIIILVVSVGGLILIGVFSGDAVAEQIDQLGTQIRPAIEQLETSFSQYGWGERVLSGAQDISLGQALPSLSDMLGSFLTGIIFAVVIFIGGLLIAFEPERYREGILSTVPKSWQARTRRILERMRDRLYRWTIGRLASMFVVFLLTGLGLWIIGAPLPWLLALIAGLLSFIPNFGPIASAVLAALVGLSVSPTMALYILLLFGAVQLIESNLITPFIERRAVYLPAGFILLVQTLMGLAFGLLGLLVATPLTVAVIAIIKGVRE